jgi:phosphatidylserine/phosphatidylglycerophosphate/cardiolipin synthase-like enzyme
MAKDIPGMYRVLSSQVLRRFMDSGSNLDVSEYRHPLEFLTPDGKGNMVTKEKLGKFHVKGIWMNSETEDRYIDTIIGSSNFNFRSRYIDTEINSYISSNDSDFKDHLVREYNSIKIKSNSDFS